jgi:polyisoprenoid-binding protein YceI
VVALAGASITALAIVRERTSITIAQDAEPATRGPDPIALLAADVREARSDLKALSEAIPDNLQTLHDALEQAAAERERASRTEITRLNERVAELRAELDRAAASEASARAELAQAVQRLQASVEADFAARVALAAQSEAASQPERPVEAVAVAAPPAEPEVAIATPPSQTTAPAEPAPEPTPKRTFLSFKLPSQSFSFDSPQRFALIPSLSRVGFDAKSTLHDFTGVTSKVDGEIVACLARPSERCAGSIVAQAASLDTGHAERDTAMREHLAVEQHAEIRFEWTAFDAGEIDAAAMKLSGTARGRMTIRGVTRDFALPVKLAVDDAKRLSIEGQGKLKLSDYQVPVPNKLGLISMEDEVVVWIALRAKSLGAAEKPGDGQ